MQEVQLGLGHPTGTQARMQYFEWGKGSMDFIDHEIFLVPHPKEPEVHGSLYNFSYLFFNQKRVH